jgi:hypothetical protein
MSAKNDNLTTSKLDIADASHLTMILTNISGSHKNLLEEMRWNFVSITIDFFSIQSLKRTYPNWCKKIDIDIVWLAKILFLESIKDTKSPSLIRAKFHSIIKTFYYLAQINQLQINQTYLPDYINYLLAHGVHEGVPSIRLSPIPYDTYIRGINIYDWNKIQKLNQLPKIGFTSNFSNSFILKILKNTINTLSAGDLTYSDWVEGGNFNHLTLDYGKYFIDHVSTFFHNHITMAIALKRTLRQGAEIIAKAGLSPKERTLKSQWMIIISHFLSGKDVSDISPAYKSKTNDRRLCTIQKITLETLRENLLPLHVLNLLLSENELYDIAKSSGVNLQNDHQQSWLKHLVELRWSMLNPKYEQSQNILKATEYEYLMQVVSADIDIDTIVNTIDSKLYHLTKTTELQLPNQSFFHSLGISTNKAHKSKDIHSFIRLVEDSGKTLFIALTGWRESEFGFSLKNMKIRPNLDILDQYSCPVRYEIEWVVPKTGGDTKVKREITRTSYLCAMKMALLVNAKNEFPCLYSFNVLTKNPNNSASFIKGIFVNAWAHFVQNYEPFTKLALLDELTGLQKIFKLSDEDEFRYNYLSKRYVEENWDKLELDPLLREAYRRSKNEFDRVSFFQNTDIRHGYVWAYRIGTLNLEHRKILDQYLSEETKQAINNLKSENEVTHIFTRNITNEIIGDCLYPTPHAFRHMWAEAVYRRFDGDAGWMIRSNFKHISQSMWLAYIRNKDNRRQHDRVKRQVVSSLLSNYIRKKGRGYAGSTDKLLRRLFLRTQTATLDQLDIAIEQFSQIEIEDIKSNPWGFCILRKRSHLYAKCAELGTPQRQNASPSLCLGCTNNFIQDGNVEGILLGISNDINIIQNQKIPEAFRKASLKTIKYAHNQLKKLNVDEKYIIDIENALNKVENKTL